MKDEICKGIPDLDSPSLEPFPFGTVAISDTDNAKLYLRDVNMTGLCDFTLNSLQSDIDKLHFDLNVLFKRVYLNGTYDFDIRVLVPVVQKGPINFIIGTYRFSIKIKEKFTEIYFNKL